MKPQRIHIVFLCIIFGLPAVGLSAAPADADVGIFSTESSESDLRAIVRAVSSEHGIDPRLVDALVRVESDYNPKAVSRKGAMGLMQLMPATARRLSVDDPFDPEQNVRGGVREFSRLLERYVGDVDLALAAYNAGEGAVARYRGIPPYRETRSYVARIMELYTGRPYRRVREKQLSRPVRLMRDHAGGGVLISNLGISGSTGAKGPALELGGGFGK